MNQPEVKINNLQVNIKVPEQLHLVQAHHGKKQVHKKEEDDIELIKQESNNAQNQQINSTPHKIRHIQSIDDKGEFIDEKHHSRVSQNDQVRETINRTLYPEPQLPMNDVQLQKIVQQNLCQEGTSKPFKHININNLQDKDEFNLRNSRQRNQQRKRRLSQSNLQNYIQVNNHFSVVNYLNQQQKMVPQRIIQQQAQVDKKQKQCLSPARRDRRKSVHSIHRKSIGSSNGGVSQEIQRMIVDELDKKKRNKIEQQLPEQLNQNQMQSIKQEKQEQDIVNISKLQQARQKMQLQIDNLSKVIGKQIGPQSAQHILLLKQQSIKEDPKEERQQ